MRNIILLIFCLLFSIQLIAKEPITIFMIGDSTMADRYPQDDNPERGWGQMISLFFTDEVIVYNHAMNGRSSLSFIDEGRWDVVLSKLKRGDYVFIQFGHNDEKPEDSLHTVPGRSFDDNLRRFVHESRKKGANPVLFNSIVRRNFPPPGQKEHQYTYEAEGDILVDTHGEYVNSPKNVAKEMNVPFVDMNRLTHNLISELGREKSKNLFLWLPANKYKSYPDGKVDNTHFNVLGAKIMAKIAVDAVVKIIPELKSHISSYKFSINKGNNSRENLYITPYKDNKICAISHTFDDGLLEHYTQVFPQMQKYGFKGTFWICGNIIENLDNQQNKGRMTWHHMKEMSDAGHEMSNHSWSHPDLTKLNEETLRNEINRNDSIILQNIGKKPTTFCYPFNSFNQKVQRKASKGRVGTRTKQTSIGGEVSKSTIESLDNWVQQLLLSGGWGVSMIHGINSGYDAFTSPDILWEHFARVKKLEDKIWIDTFAAITTYTKTRENILLEINQNKDSIIITPHISLDPVLFADELTMVLNKDIKQDVKAIQNNKILQVRNKNESAIFDIHPFGGHIKIYFTEISNKKK